VPQPVPDESKAHFVNRPIDVGPHASLLRVVVLDEPSAAYLYQDFLRRIGGIDAWVVREVAPSSCRYVSAGIILTCP